MLFTTQCNRTVHQQRKNSETILLKEKSVSLSIFTNTGIDNGILRAVKNLQSDFQKVTGVQPIILNQISGTDSPLIIIGTVGTKSVIDDLIKQKKIDGKSLTGKNEKYIIQNVSHPFPAFLKQSSLPEATKEEPFTAFTRCLSKSGFRHGITGQMFRFRKRKTYILKKECIQTENPQ